jgi:Zn-dependent peptidase ImmA (M78 family)
MKPEELACRVYERFQTRDVFQIARSARLGIVYQKWHPVTAGELHRRSRTIYVNENAALDRATIVAHELGHFFLREYGVHKVLDEEKFCDRFAECFLKSE